MNIENFFSCQETARATLPMASTFLKNKIKVIRKLTCINPGRGVLMKTASLDIMSNSVYPVM
jgi:hypothetical protein